MIYFSNYRSLSDFRSETITYVCFIEKHKLSLPSLARDHRTRVCVLLIINMSFSDDFFFVVYLFFN